MFSRIIECKTCLKSDLLFERKLVDKWVSGKRSLAGRLVVGGFSKTLS